jgi:hypothetical protein
MVRNEGADQYGISYYTQDEDARRHSVYAYCTQDYAVNPSLGVRIVATY